MPACGSSDHRRRSISRRQLLLSTATAGLGARALAGSQAPAGKPNIVFIMADDMGTFDVSAFGSKAVQTPNIDRLAKEGMLFTQAYAGCTVCAPSRSTLMTGRHMGHTSIRVNPGGAPLLAEDVTVAEVLKKAGYATGGFGKWGLGDLDTTGVPERHGFDRFFGYYHQVHAHYYYPDYLIDTGAKVPLPGNKGFYEQKPPSGGMPVKDPKTGLRREFAGSRIFNEMKGFIRQSKDKPFFCYAPWTPPHARYELPEDDPGWQMYKDKPWSLQAKVHAAFVSMVDRHVGETMALLKELKLDEKTLVIFCSDNGASNRFDGELNSSGPLRGQKTSMYEGGIRTPFIARWPGRIKAGSTSDLPIYFPDFLPTAADLAGVSGSVPPGIDGISILPELTGRSKLSRDRHLYWEWNAEHFSTDLRPKLQACRAGRWKVVRHQLGAEWELYDLSADIGEKNDLAARHPEIVKRLDAWVKANRTDARDQKEPEKPKGQRWR